MTLKELIRYRLQNQQIVQHDFDKPGELVKWFGAMQAQDYLNSLWAVGLRLANKSEGDIEKAIAEKTIIRTWPMRGTLHFVAPEDVRWMLKLLTPRVVKRAAGIYRQSGLDEKIFKKSRKILCNVLQSGKHLTRTDIYEALEKGKISTAEQRGLHIIGKLAQEGLICLAAREGKQQTFALLDEWVPSGATLTTDEAMTELAKRYFTSHGPATAYDFAWWSGLTITEVKRSVEMVGSYLRKEMIDDQAYYLTDKISPAKGKAGAAYLLPTFDEYLVAYKNRSAPLDLKYGNQVIGATGNGIFSAVIVIDGRVAGTWKRTFKRDTVFVEMNQFSPLSGKQNKLISSAIKRYGKFLKMKVEQV